MYKLISVIISLNLVLLSASNEGLVKKEINSQSKLSKTEFISKNNNKTESKLRSKTSARELESLNHKKLKNDIDANELKGGLVENLNINSKSIHLQKIEMGHEETGVIRRPNFVQGPRLVNNAISSLATRDGHDAQIFISEYCDYQPVVIQALGLLRFITQLVKM